MLLMTVLVLILVMLFTLIIAPGMLRRAVVWVVGEAEIPSWSTVPPPPVIEVPRGSPPAGYLGLTGRGENGAEFACGFLMELEDGWRVAVGAAHVAVYQTGVPVALEDSEGRVAARLTGQLDLGRPYIREHLTMDYVFYSVDPNGSPAEVLKPDPRGQGQPGERVWVFGRSGDGAGGSKGWPGVVMQVDPEVTWLQMEDSFYPVGFSGCPAVSQYTGRVIGMVLAGADRSPVVMGLHPVGSLVEKAQKARPVP